MVGDEIAAAKQETPRARLGPRPKSSRGYAPYWAATAFYLVFIARNSFVLEGRRAFGLFDDAMVSMTYARNLASGHGLVWMPGGPRVEGFTNPLWTLIMALPHALGLPDRLASLPIIVLGGALLLVCAALGRALAARVAPEEPLAATMTPWLIAFCYPLVYWTLRGLEVGLVTAMVLGGALLALRVADGDRRAGPPLAATVGLGILTRLDFWVFVPVFLGFIAIAARGGTGRRAIVLVASVALLTTAGIEAARLAYYGQALPNTFALKTEGVGLATRLARGLRSFAFFSLAEVEAVLVVAGTAFWLRRRQAPVRLLAALFAAGAAYSIVVGGDAWEWMRIPNRFLLPGLVALLCLAPAGAFAVARRLTRPEHRRERLLIAGALAAVSLLAMFGLTPGSAVASAPDAPTAVIALGAAAVPFLLVSLAMPRIGGSGEPAAVAPMLLVSLLFQLSGPAGGLWVILGAVHARDDAQTARYARLMASASDNASLAVVWAGGFGYFSRVPAIDLLGRCDSRIAHLEPRGDLPFWPGHSKWDYGLSVLTDRPDFVLQLWNPTPAEIDRMLCSGYVSVTPRPDRVARFGLETAPRLLARADSRRIDWLAFDRLPRACSAAGGAGP